MTFQEELSSTQVTISLTRLYNITYNAIEMLNQNALLQQENADLKARLTKVERVNKK